MITAIAPCQLEQIYSDFATSHKPKINRHGFAKPAFMCLSFAPCDNNYYKMVSKYGKLSRTSSFCPVGKVLTDLLAQIVLGSDCSGSVKDTAITSASFENY